LRASSPGRTSRLPRELGDGHALAELDRDDVGVVGRLALLVLAPSKPYRAGSERMSFACQRPEHVALGLVRGRATW
jgi:hypothetical protein